MNEDIKELQATIDFLNNRIEELEKELNEKTQIFKQIEDMAHYAY